MRSKRRKKIERKKNLLTYLCIHCMEYVVCVCLHHFKAPRIIFKKSVYICSPIVLRHNLTHIFVVSTIARSYSYTCNIYLYTHTQKRAVLKNILIHTYNVVAIRNKGCCVYDNIIFWMALERNNIQLDDSPSIQSVTIRLCSIFRRIAALFPKICF